MIGVVKWQNVAFVLTLIVLCELVLSVYLTFDRIDSKSASTAPYKVVVDAGHGGVDGGVIGCDGVKESSLNLAYALTLGEMLENCGFDVVYTRKTEGGLYGLPTKGFKSRDMKARKKVIEQAAPNLVVSVHMNNYAPVPSRKGPQVFCQKGSVDGKRFADGMQKVFNDFTGNDHQAIQGDYYICREAACPSIICECGFLSNPQECVLLQTDEYRQSLCKEMLRGILYYLSFT